MKKLSSTLLVCLVSLTISLVEVWGAEFCVSTVAEFEAALNQAATNGQDDIIKVVWGTYKRAFLFRSDEGKSITLKGGYFPGCSNRILNPNSTILDSDFQYNPLSIHNNNGGDITVEGFTLRNGVNGGSDLRTTASGVGVRSGHIRFEKNIVTNNQWATGAGTGGVNAWTISDNGSSGDITFTGNIIVNNRGSTLYGGGINAVSQSQANGGSSGAISFVNNMIINNTGARSGGGIYIKSFATYTGTISIVNNTITGNSALESGGGISIDSRGGYVEFTNNIVWGNMAPNGGDVHLYCSLSCPAYRYNNNVANWGGNSWEGGGNINADPLFINPNMGDYRLRPGSPCIDAGVNVGTLPVDFEGDPRPVGTWFDIGADEYNLISHCVSNPTGLQSALTAAQSNGKGDIIRVVQGTYAGNFSFTSNEGRGIILEGGYVSGCTSRILNSSNTILDGEGSGSVLTLRNTNGGDISVDGFTIRNGSSTAYGGGGMLAVSESDSLSGDIKITNNLITGNRVSSYLGYGGGLCADSYSASSLSGVVTIANNRVRGNSSKQGGGIWARSASNSGKAGRVMLINNMVTENTASQDGGGVLANSNSYAGISGKVVLTNNTITSNNATRYGGGFKIEIWGTAGHAYVYNNIAWGNTAPSGGDIYLDKDSECSAYANKNDVRYWGGSSWTTSVGNMNADPLWVNPTLGNYHLLSNSPCVDSGNNNPPDGLIGIDFEGDPRKINGVVDIGADEYKQKPVKIDFNGDEKSDILWMHPASGTVAIWQMVGTTISSVGVAGAVPTGWEIKGVGDFNGDGKADVLWMHPASGTVAIWFMNGTAISMIGIPGAVSSGWEMKGVGDFNNDSKSDILWMHLSTGTVAIWMMNVAIISSVGVAGAVPSGWEIKGVGDFNADSKSDVLWFHPATGTVAVWMMDGMSISSVGVAGAVPSGWEIKGVGDFNADSKFDVLWFHPATGTVAIWMMDGMSISSVGVAGSVPSGWEIKN